jgi:hypothetical protein
VECPGKYSRLTTVWLDPTAPVIDSLDLQLFDHDVTGVPGTLAGDVLNVLIYPNPATAVVRMAVGLKRPATLACEMRTLSGGLVSEFSYPCTAGPSVISMSIPAVSPGLYMMMIRSVDGTLHAVKKLVVY